MYLRDPRTKQKSVSLTLLLITFLLALAAIGLEIAGLSKTTSGALELFYANAGLYFGRRFASQKGSILDTTKDEDK